MFLQIQDSDWNEIGATLEELYGMSHTVNDFLNHDKLEIAIKEAVAVEKQVVKVLDLYNKIERSLD